MVVAEIEALILDVARECYDKGAGYAQEYVVLREIAERAKPSTLAEEQAILRAWQRHFTTGKLAWGYDLDNPDSPFFHVPDDSD